MPNTYAVDCYRRGTLVISATQPTFLMARAEALAFVRRELAGGDPMAAAYVRAAGSATVRFYRVFVNRAGRVQAQST